MSGDIFTFRMIIVNVGFIIKFIVQHDSSSIVLGWAWEILAVF